MIDHGRTRERLCHQLLDEKPLDEHPCTAHLARRYAAESCQTLQRLRVNLQQRCRFREIEGAHRAQLVRALRSNGDHVAANIDAKLPGNVGSSRSGSRST